MYRKLINQQRGFTLIECIISIALISIVIVSSSSLFYFTFNSYSHYTELWEAEYNTNTVLKYIEKRLREFNQEGIIFDSKKNIFQGKNYDNKDVWVDLSGEVPKKQNTSLIYFHRSKKEVRVNKNNEHNVLSSNIADIIVNELVEGKLIEIEVIANKTRYSNKIKLNLNYRKN